MPAVQRQALFERARRATVMIARKEGNKLFKPTGSGFAVARKHFGAGGHCLCRSRSESAERQASHSHNLDAGRPSPKDRQLDTSAGDFRD